MSTVGASSNKQTVSELLFDALRFTIGGVIWRITQTHTGPQREPWAKVTVQIEGTGRFADTDEQGRYRFYNLPPGHYPLVIRAQAKSPQVGDKLADGPTITVPPAPYDAEIVIEILPDDKDRSTPSAEQPSGTPEAQTSVTPDVFPASEAFVDELPAADVPDVSPDNTVASNTKRKLSPATKGKQKR